VTSGDAYDLLAPYIREHIYKQGWHDLRPVQTAACEALFFHDEHVLLSSRTASGKTEAAFLPCLTLLEKSPPRGVGILYISPLKALINDQFVRLRPLLEEGKIPVCKWHGDAPLSAKQRLTKQPRGVLQITPESLESLMHRAPDVRRMLADLRFVIVDEVHYFMGCERGAQLQCLLQRLERLAGCSPRRIGLSATLGDPLLAMDWLSAGTNRACLHPEADEAKRRLRIRLRYFPLEMISDDDEDDGGVQRAQLLLDKDLFEWTTNRKTIVFTKSRADAERAVVSLKAIAKNVHAPDVYRVHHGSVSAALREEAEREMKQDERPIVTAATLTLELGIDIGDLACVAQLGSPISVSSFTQRIGRCGRQGQMADLLFSLRQETSARPEDPLSKIDWDLIKSIAVIELFLKDRWVEPCAPPKLPFSLLFHQTMQILLQTGGEMTPARLAQEVLTLAAFRCVTQDDYKILLRYLLNEGWLERSETGGLLIGVKAEPIVTFYEFLAVFQTPDEYEVWHRQKNIGTVSQLFQPGDSFALAGHNWQVVDVNEAKKRIAVQPVRSVGVIRFQSFLQAQTHEILLQKMKAVLADGGDYPYLDVNARDALQLARRVAGEIGILDHWIYENEPHRPAIFPWIDTKQLLTLQISLAELGISTEITLGGYMPLYLSVTDGMHTAHHLRQALQKIRSRGVDIETLAIPDSIRPDQKFDKFIPNELLIRQVKADYLDADGLRESLRFF
jgi:ATP-dependent Lhr-like helicase